MKKLNILYDTWMDNEILPQTSGEDIIGADNVRSVLGLFTFYDFENINLCDFTKINDEENFFYFISYVSTTIDMINGIKNFNHKIFDLINKKNNVYLVLISEHESMDFENFKYLIDFFTEKKISINNLIIINNNPLLEYYKHITKSNVIVHKINFLNKVTAKNIIKFNDQNIFTKEKKGKFFLCHNRYPKEHRYVLLMMMMKEKILDDVDWSLIMGKFFIENYEEKIGFYGRIIPRNEMIFYENEINFFNNLECKKSDYEIRKDWFNDNKLPWDDIFEIETFKNSYINITTESEYFTDSIHVSEKSLKPFYFYQIPIIVATKNHVKYMKEQYGFDFFDDLINHGYDNEDNPQKRIKFIFEEIKNLKNNKTEVIKFYQNNYQRFENNRKIVENLNFDDSDTRFFEKLIDIKNV